MFIVYILKQRFATEQEVKVKTADTSVDLIRVWLQFGYAWMIVNLEKAHQDWS